MTAVVAIQVVAIQVVAFPTGRWRSTVTAVVAVPLGRWRLTVTAVVAVPTGRWRSTVTAVVMTSLRWSPGRWRSTMTIVTTPFRLVAGDQPSPQLPPSLVHSTEHSCRDSVFASFWHIKKVLGRTAMQTFSRAEGMSVDTNSLRHLPRQSSKNCCL